MRCRKMNVNYEDDTRHEVTDRMLRNIEKVSYAQDDIGVDKYKTALHYSLDFDWLQMLTEEMVDGLKYLQCEMDRKNYVIDMLEAGMRSNEPKEYIEIALQLLNVKGTGK
jgi:hypothetical protein